MLALTRKKNESIIIGDKIEIVVLNIQGEQVKLGIQAPREITVHRKEIFEQIRLENMAAAQASSGEAGKLKDVYSLLKYRRSEQEQTEQ